jgi:hypothetical protein
MQSARVFLLFYQNYHCSMKSLRIFMLRYQKIIIVPWGALPFSCCAIKKLSSFSFSCCAIKIIIISCRALTFSYCAIKIIIVPWRALAFSCCAIKKLSLFHKELSHFLVVLSKNYHPSMQCAHIFLLRF